MAQTTIASSPRAGGWLGLTGRVCVVTGAGSGIGKAIATGLAEAGGHIVVIDLDRASAEAVAAGITSAGGQALAIACDTSSQAAVTATLSLEDSAEALWKGFRGEIRNRVRKAEKNGMEVKVGRDQLPGFYEVLASNMHRKGTPIYGLRFMESLLQSFGDRAYVMTLSLKGETVAGALVVEHRGVVNVPFVSSLQRAFTLAPSNLLYWEIIKKSYERRQVVLDFGRSFRHSSNLDFKTRWGATVIPQPFHFVYRGAPPRVDPGDPLVEKLVELWKRLPRGLADRLGPIICGRFLV